jgi:hypothetical protein
MQKKKNNSAITTLSFLIYSPTIYHRDVGAVQDGPSCSLSLPPPAEHDKLLAQIYCCAMQLSFLWGKRIQEHGHSKFLEIQM